MALFWVRNMKLDPGFLGNVLGPQDSVRHLSADHPRTVGLAGSQRWPMRCMQEGDHGPGSLFFEMFSGSVSSSGKSGRAAGGVQTVPVSLSEVPLCTHFPCALWQGCLHARPHLSPTRSSLSAVGVHLPQPTGTFLRPPHPQVRLTTSVTF